jgi:hypothetical protein
MAQLSRQDLMSLEDYAVHRDEMRQQVMAAKKARRIAVGPHVMLHFENQLIMQYQIQEMLRAEKIFEAAGIEEELEAYNPLIPDGSNWKATMMIEYPDPEIRAKELAKLIGIEDKTWVQVEGFDKVFAIANEDLERSTEEKTSSVHFMRFELSDEMIAALKSGASVSVGINHENYRHSVMLDSDSRASLLEDLT